MQEDQMTKVPLWVVASLGKPVLLTAEYAGPDRTYPVGHSCLLQGILVNENYDGLPYAILSPDPEDDSYLENFRFDQIRPVTNKVKFSLNMEQGVIAF
jgi:hypothetical protein